MHIRFALYDGELVEEVEKDQWYGYDVDLINQMSQMGGFTYEFVSMGRNGVNFTSYSDEARRFLLPNTTDCGAHCGDDLADVMGNPTWRVLESRLPWAVFSAGFVTQDCQFVTKLNKPHRLTTTDYFTFLLKPFRTEVWLAMLGMFGLYTFTLIWSTKCSRHATLERNFDDSNQGASQSGFTVNNMQVFDLTYHTCLSACEEHQLEMTSKHMKIMQLAWIFMVLILFEIYSASLTSILTVSVSAPQTLTGMDVCEQENCVFCTQKGAANDAYFRKHFTGVNIKSEASISAQISQLLSDEPGSCEALELTREDLNRWASQANVERCGIQMAPNPIMERQVYIHLLGHQALSHLLALELRRVHIACHAHARLCAFHKRKELRFWHTGLSAHAVCQH